MNTRTHAPPDSSIDRYSDACEHCLPLYNDPTKYTALPKRIRPTSSGIIARYRHTCGHTWTVGWFYDRT